MAQAASADYDQSQSDPSLTGPGEDETQGKTSLFGKLRNKTKDKTNKLKTKLKPASKTGEEVVEGNSKPTEEVNEDSSSSSSSEDESEAPVNNAMSGVTQPEYGRTAAEQPVYQPKGPPAEPTRNFPGNFAGIADGEAEGKEDESELSKDFQGLSTNDNDQSTETQPSSDSRSADEFDSSTPMTEKVQENVSSAKDSTVEKFTSASGDSEQKYSAPDTAPVTEKTQEVGEKATEAGKTWSQWAAEKVGYAKDTAGEKASAAKDVAAEKAPTTADGKPVHEEAYGAAVGAKDTAVLKATEAKDSLAAQVPERSSITSDPAQQTYVQKATGGIYGAKDKLFTSTQPGEHDKALSQKVTESVGNFPATLKSTLGFGGKASGASSPTTTPASSDAPLSTSAEEASGAPPQSPGIVSRITGLFGAKKPATDSSTSPPESVISETGPETQTEVSESADKS